MRNMGSRTKCRWLHGPHAIVICLCILGPTAKTFPCTTARTWGRGRRLTSRCDVLEACEATAIRGLRSHSSAATSCAQLLPPS
ncbi:hypothetical protein BD311DRAFT_755392 [Dichomitus squalens]|uniref:Secreted protein n=1 Tax=Dichomitus squalens TaxID=114155 RepID=A0A4Q9MQY8_9APHY|nr:hypothetical protein BD311DRAFT_755392 [Dichomitus squalens]